MRRNIFHLLALLQIFLVVFAVKNVRAEETASDKEGGASGSGKDEEKDDSKDKEKKDEDKSQGDSGNKRVEMCGPGFAAECVPIGGMGEEEDSVKDCAEYKVELTSKDQQSVGVNPECTEVAAEAKSKGLVPVSVYTLFASPDAQRSEGVPTNLYALTSSLFFNAAKNGSGGQNGAKNYTFLRGSVARAFGGHPPEGEQKPNGKDKDKDKGKTKDKPKEDKPKEEKPKDEEKGTSGEGEEKGTEGEAGSQLVDDNSTLVEKKSKGNSSLF